MGDEEAPVEDRTWPKWMTARGTLGKRKFREQVERERETYLTTARVIRRALLTGYYSVERTTALWPIPYMCQALACLQYDDLITEKEKTLACDEIIKRIEYFHTLYGLLTQRASPRWMTACPLERHFIACKFYWNLSRTLERDARSLEKLRRV